MAKKIMITEKENNKNNLTKKDFLKTMSIIINGCLVIIILILIFGYNNKIKSVEQERDSIDTTCAYKTSTDCFFEYDTEIEKAKFLDDNIVFVLEGYGNVYYTYDCVQKITNGEYTYWAYNIDAAKSKGYKAGRC